MRRRPARALSDSLEARVLLSTAMPAFDAAEPTGSMAYRSTAFGTAAAGAEAGRYDFSAAAGQKLAIAVAPLTSPGLDVAVELRDPAGNVVATSNAQGAGGTEIIQPVEAPTSGQYEVVVQPVSGSGTFRLDVMLGSSIEAEGGASGNDSPAAAQDIGGSFTDLGGGASRGAVAGAVADAVTLNGNAESFESGTLGPAFATTVTGSGTGAQVIPIAYDNPNKVLWLHGDYDRATGGLVEVVWTVSLTGATDANLTFRASHSFNDFTQFSGDFVGHYNADGVAISDNGLNWHPVLTVPDTNGAFNDYTVDLDAEAAKAGMSLTGAFQIKFQYYDDYAFGSSGLAFDDLKVTRPDQDWYAFPAAAGDRLSLATDIDAGVLELYDTQGHLLGVGGAAPNATRGVVVQDVEAPVGGTYRARISAPSSTAYGLAVYRNASLNLAPHRPTDPPQDIGDTGRVAGATSTNWGRVFGYRDSQFPSLRGIVEVDPKTGALSTVSNSGYYTSVTTTPGGVMTTGSNPSGIRVLLELDPDTGAVRRSIPLGGSSDPGGVTYFNGELFLANGGVLDYVTGAFKRQIDPPGAVLTATATKLIGVSLFPNVGYGLYEVDPQTGTKTGFGNVFHPQTPNLNPPEGLAAIGNELYLRLSTEVYVHVIDLATQRVLRRLTTPFQNSNLNGELGADGGPGGNTYYSLPVRAGDALTLTTSTPAVPPGSALAPLDPVLELYSPSGQLVASDDNSAADGRNAIVAHTAAQTGTYQVRVRATAGSGDFVLSAAGYTGGVPAARVTGSDPANGADLPSAPQSVTLDFSAPLSATSLQPADLTVDGRPATAATLLDPDTVRFTLPTTENGRHVLRLAAGALSATSGAPVREYFGEFAVHLAAPRVVSTSLAQGAELLPGPLSIDVRFDKPLAAANLDPSDFALVSRDTGAVRTQSTWSYDPLTTTLHLDYPAQPGDHYALVLYSGNNRFEGLDGGDLDGEGAALPSGDGAPGGSFVLNFALQQPGATAAPSNLVAYPISGSEIELAWRDNSASERGFRVDRAAGDGDFVEAATLAPNTVIYNDTSAQPGVFYRYRVRAFVVAGPSAWSDPFTSTVLPPELTTPVKRFAALPEVSTPLEADPTAVMTVAPGVGVFVAKDSSFDNLLHPHVQVWRTDGTPDGTTLLKDLGRAGLYQALGVAGGAAVFTYYDPVTDSVALWKSDGTAAGTVALKPLGQGYQIQPKGIANGVIYFIGPSGQWRTDGTVAGTYLDPNTVPPGIDDFGQSAQIGDAYYGVDSRGLYRRVGAPGTEVVLKTVAPGGSVYRLTPVGDRLAFVVEEWETHPDGSMDLHEDLWVTDGTPGGTTRFAAFKNIGNHGMSPLTAVGSNLYFMVNSAGSAIWKSDLTAQGTALVITVGGVAKNFAAFGNLFTFSGGPASQLWATDGTAAGTRRVSNIGALVQPPHPDWMTAIGNTVYFVSSGRYNSGEWYAGYGEELWKTDGTPEGTVRLFRGQVHDLIDFNGTLYFAGSRPQGGYELWKSDGTAGGTVRVKDVQPTNAGTNLRLLSVANGRLFFGVNSGFAYQDSDFQLWSTDGTEAGTAKVTDEPMYVDITSMAPNAMHVYAGAGNYFYFRRHGGGDILSDQLWRSDGTAAGTSRVGTAMDPRNVTDLNGTLYFTATNPGGFTGETLYKVAPGAAQPSAVRTFTSGDYRLVSALTKVGANLFLSAPTGSSMGLWKVDGATGAATMLRIVPGSTAEPSSPRVLYVTDVDGAAYFVMSETDPENVDGIVGGLWKSDGTAAGTLKVRNFSAPVYSTPLFFVSAGGKLVYSDGTNLWRSNGTRGGTVQILRLRDPLEPTFFPPYFGGPAAAVVGDRVFFSASVAGGDPRARELRVASLTTPDAPSDLIVVDQTPEGATISAQAAGGVRVAWRDNSANESGFVVERSRTADFALPDATFYRPANSTSFVDLTGPAGTVYYYRVRAVNAGGDSAATDPATKSAAVAGRYVFYNHSAFDGNDAAAGAADDAAVAIDKHAYVPGPSSAADFGSVTGYSRGINGVMIDVAGLPAAGLTAADFDLSVGGGASWSAAPAPTSVTVRRGAGTSGTDRVTLTFADGSVRNTWLRVTLLANPRTGLARPDVFYFGNLVGETGDHAGTLKVTAFDLAATLRALRRTSTVTGKYDTNRDGRVDALDVAAVRSNLNRTLAPNVGAPVVAAPPAAPTPPRSTYRGATRDLFQDATPIV